MTIKIGYSVFLGIAVAATICLFKLYWLWSFPGELRYEHLFLPIYAIVFVMISAALGERLSARLEQPPNYWLSAFLTAAIYTFCMSFGILIDASLYPLSCIVPFFMRVMCPAPSFTIWFSDLARPAILLFPGIFIITKLYLIYRAKQRR